MNTHSPVRFIVGIVLLAGIVSSGHAQTPETAALAPSFEERLELLAGEIDQNRVALGVPGAALAIVRGDAIVFARGFGMADVEAGTPATPQTPFFIGSSTKAFTSMLVGMLVDETLLDLDIPIEQYVPTFSLAVDSDDGRRATLRDVLSHRTGFPRMGFLWSGGGLSSDEVLAQASLAEPMAPLGARFQYNNVHYLAAGAAAAAVTGRSWNDLIAGRILGPLGMADTRTSIAAAEDNPRMARGYTSDGPDDTAIRPVNLSTEGLNIDVVAPAGAISSTAVDMAAWLRFLLAGGVVDGQRLVAAETLQELWTRQIPIDRSIGYGLGWFVRDWQGQPLIEHGGSLPGFSAEVGLLPESDLGFVLLTNRQSTLAPMAATLVPQYLLGTIASTENRTTEDLTPYTGRYVANFATFSNEIFTVSERDGRLILDIPSQTEYALNPPGENGQWPFVLTDQIAVSFQRDAEANVISLHMHQSGFEFEVPREGVAFVPDPDVDVAALERYVGTYRVEGGIELTLLIENQRLATRPPNGGLIDFNLPDDNGRWVSRANPDLAITFEESGSDVAALTLYRPGGLPGVRLDRTASDLPPLPTLEELMTLRGVSGGSGNTATRMTGRIRFPQSAVEGEVETTIAGDDRLRTEIDLGRYGRIRVAVNPDGGSRDSTMEPFTALTGDMLAQVRLGHPAVLFGDWRMYYDTIRVERTAEVDGRRIYQVRLTRDGLPPTQVGVDVETGDILRVQTTQILPGGLGALPVTSRYDDYRDVDGVRMPFRSIETNAETGQTIVEIESIVTGVDVDENEFVIRAGDLVR